MFDYIQDKSLKKAVTDAYSACKKDDDFGLFVDFLDRLDIPASISMKVVLDVLVHSKPITEGISRGIRELLTATGKRQYDSVAIDDTDDGIKKLNFAKPEPFHTSVMLANGPYGLKLDCYSILGRTRSEYGNDGNPLIYALKRINNWRFASSADYKQLLDYFVSVLESKYGHQLLDNIDYVIPIPSSHCINQGIISCIKRYCRPEIVTLDCIGKHSVDSVYDQFDADTVEYIVEHELFPGINTNSTTYNQEITNFARKLAEWRRKNTEANREAGVQGNPFSIKHVEPKYRQLFHDYISGTFPDGIFTDKNVLIVDDSIATGSSLKSVAERFVLPQNPKSIKALTLLSPILR